MAETRNVKAIIDGQTREVPVLSEFREILNLSDNTRYEDNPIVGVYANDVLSSVTDLIKGDTHIEPVRLFSKSGRRIYRKTLTLLLSYASSLIYPGRKLVIGHSLGDGYYFRYSGGEKDIDVDALNRKMREIVERKEKINIKKLQYDDALEYMDKCGFESTALLLETRNDDAYKMVNIGSYYQLYLEPVLTDMSLVTLWELRAYEDGLLLRYPQSRSLTEILDFHDNPKLFSLFQDTRKECENLDLFSIGELNRRIASGDIEHTILLLEAQMERRYMRAAKKIIENPDVKFVFIAGPSSSGKTTSSLKLSDYLRLYGKKPIRMGMDDYYLHRDLVPRDEKGDYDFECLEAVDVPAFRADMETLLAGGEIFLPTFNFKTQQRIRAEKGTRLEENGIMVIEGLHGLNPNLVPEIDNSKIARVYISALTQLNLDSQTRISTTDNRILRRMVRDNRTRGIDAKETLRRWPSVEAGEKKHIFPFQNNADIVINSALDYELGVLKIYAEPLLRSVKRSDGEPYTIARRLLAFLDYIYPISEKTVPLDSILREFIGGGIYNVT